MHLYESATYWHIKIRPSRTDVFTNKADCFSFLSVWRTYFINSLSTCTYVLVPGEFSAIVVPLAGRDVNAEKIEHFIATKLQKKLSGIFPQDQIDLMVSGISAVPLKTEKECMQTTLEIHRMPQKQGLSSDYRSYPFSSYKTLNSSGPTLINRQVVLTWFGGKHQFHMNHQGSSGQAATEVFSNHIS
ncbi:MAG: hypothetical protein LAT84_12385 [Balneolia bacterium]|nr:hypothetical protein [Balneolia bacterium]